MLKKILWVLVAATSCLSASTAAAGEPAAPAAATAPSVHGPSACEAERRLVAAKVELMSADYRADLGALMRLRQEVSALESDPGVGYLAHYWAGFASWRLAINGFNRSLRRDAIKPHLEDAVADFDAAVALRDDFADAYAAGASSKGWLAAWYADKPETLKTLIDSSRQMMARAKQLAPANPRVEWVETGILFATPPQFGGDPPRAMAVLRQALAGSDFSASPASPLPDWGRPELLMSLAWGSLNQASPPDLAAARGNAEEALRLRPDWFYVREILLPQIDLAERRAGEPSGR